MRKMKISGKGSFLKSVLRVLGVDRGSALPSLSQAEIEPSVSVSFPSHDLTRNALLKAEQAKTNAIMELRRRQFI